MLNHIKSKLSRYKLTVIGALALVGLFLVIFIALVQLTKSSIDKSRSNRSGLIERDLKDLVGQFDADERYVLEKNLNVFLKEDREFHPLLLPRQYYVALPSGLSKFIPRPPPRNCFIKLNKVDSKPNTSEKFPEKFCAYFAENKNVGSYLFFSMSIVDNQVNLLKSGDKSLSADAIEITITYQQHQSQWWLYLQPSRNVSAPDRYQITAFRQRPGNVMELDKRIEGWGYVQKQVNNTNVVNLIARLDFKEFIDSMDEQWPPKDWQDIHIEIARKDQSTNRLEAIMYEKSGSSYLSLPSLAGPIFNAYATLKIETPKVSVIVQPPSHSLKTKPTDDYFQFIDGDLLIRREPLLERNQFLQDTDLSFRVIHPGTVIEKSVWIMAFWLTTYLIIYGIFAAFIYFGVLRPIWVLSRKSRSMINSEMSGLPYSERNDEIGTLARGFNELLRETKEQAILAQEEKENQEREKRRKHEEDVRSREVTLKFIGHEIRSPLQSLNSLHKSGSQSRRYIDRMTHAINNLQSISGPESAFSSRQLFLESVELTSFLSDLAGNCDLAGIPNVIYDGPRQLIEVYVDPSILEDAITNILLNANYHRREGTPIIIKLRREKEMAIIDVVNDGPHIEDSNKEKIFDLYHTTKESTDDKMHGIGLYAVRQYVSRMNGTITVSNEIFGVNFRILLPIHK